MERKSVSPFLLRPLRSLQEFLRTRSRRQDEGKSTGADPGGTFAEVGVLADGECDRGDRP